MSHSGRTVKGSYVQTLTLTDIATGWTECTPVLVREQKLLTEVPSELRKLLPIRLGPTNDGRHARACGGGLRHV